MKDLWTAFAATWLIWVFIACMVLVWLGAERHVNNRKEDPIVWKREKITVCWTNWTFGPWAATIGRKRFRALDLGPVSLVWEKVSA